MSGKQGEWYKIGVNGRGCRRGEYIGHSLGDEPLTLTRCHSYMQPLKGGSPFVAESTTSRS